MNSGATTTSPLAPFAPFNLFREAAELEQLVSLNIAPRETAPLAQGQMLTVAIVYGALLDPRLWQHWLHAASASRRESEDGLWLEFDHDDPTLPFRWFADPLSEILVRRWKPTLPCNEIAGVDPRSLIALYLRKSGFREAEDVAERIELLAEIRWRHRIPPLLVEFARGRVVSRGVEQTEWRQICSRETCNVSPERMIRRKNGEPEAETSSTPTLAVEHALLKGASLLTTKPRWRRKDSARLICIPRLRELVETDSEYA